MRIVVLTLLNSILILSIANIEIAKTAEKWKANGTSVAVKWEQLEVGDDDGQIIAISQSKQFYINETTGERHPSIARGLMDINKKTGQAFVHTDNLYHTTGIGMLYQYLLLPSLCKIEGLK